jgi:hypothetical protein
MNINFGVFMTLYSLEEIVKKIGANSAAIMVPDSAKRYLFCYDSFNMPQAWIDIKNSFDEKVPGGNVEVYKSGRPAITNHLKTMLKGYYIESVMITPIKQDGRTIAVLEIIHNKEEKAFTEADQWAGDEYASKIEIKPAV